MKSAQKAYGLEQQLEAARSRGGQALAADWYEVIKNYAYANDAASAQRVFDEMTAAGITPNNSDWGT